MTTDSSYIESLRSEISLIYGEGAVYFSEIGELIDKDYSWHANQWDQLPSEQRGTALRIRTKLADCGVRLIEAVRKSALLEQTDETEVKRLLRGMAAALLLKEFSYHPSYVVSEEDRVFGITPAEQEESPASLAKCAKNWDRIMGQLSEILDFLAPTSENLTRAIVSSQVPGVQKYRPNTAFIIMQIDDQIPKLEDVKNSIKDVFKEFGITAVRADEIEHSDVITQRILDEIVTSELLIADLTGERPSVYYEIGYAACLGQTAHPIQGRGHSPPLRPRGSQRAFIQKCNRPQEQTACAIGNNYKPTQRITANQSPRIMWNDSPAVSTAHGFLPLLSVYPKSECNCCK